MPRLNIAVLSVFVIGIILFIFWKISEPIDEKPVNEEVLSGRLSKVQVAIYYETLCPDSRHFLIKQFGPTFNKYQDLFEYELVPYGKAETLDDHNFRCQHGFEECLGNKVHGCAAHYIKDKTTLLNYINCMIDDNRDPEKIGEKCAGQYDIDWEEIKICLKSNKSDELLKINGIKTFGLKPKVSFIPTIEFNGSQEGQAEMLKNFERYVCQRALCIYKRA